MEKEHTPAVTTPNRTVYKLSQTEGIAALENWLALCDEKVPVGKRAIFFPTHDSDRSFHIALEIFHPDPPPFVLDGPVDSIGEFDSNISDQFL